MLDQLRLGLTFTDIGTLHEIHPTRVKQIILAEIAHEQQLLNKDLVLSGQASPSTLLSEPIQRGIAACLDKDHFTQRDVEGFFQGSFAILLRQPGISSKHLKELDTWLTMRLNKR
ncbi:hypothetical protein [Phyllobacterium sp. P30BS-XVII]|uniref:hypothetical protein n=1 Tax=Phyllobacterium sp. P30BS-XVII TaxID=2587046 RepID=UPI0015FDDCDA|nr:hypothetical protein [Phyllobacterium sp. P30BS-XVII]MBA8904129.1 hypothetical protein [Phyllobacterium sp. P30BS-XVII]